jgi:L,D-peptidoglycan transpeptidase YkuD (ErfK/YbiS/YcfS/YnhG family)
VDASGTPPSVTESRDRLESEAFAALPARGCGPVRVVTHPLDAACPAMGQRPARRRSHGVRWVKVRSAWCFGFILAGALLPGRSALAQGNEQRARVLDEVRRNPLQAASFTDLAEWLFRNGDLGHAVAAAQEAARLEPAVASHYRLLGYLAAADGAEPQAEAAFTRAAALDPSADAVLADFYVARAWTAYQHALRRDPPDAAVAERLRALAALGGISPEVRALLPSAAPTSAKPAPADASVPPIWLGDDGQYGLVVEKRTQTARLYQQHGGHLVLLQTYPCTTGQESGPKHRRGDRRTPDGVYVLTDLLPGDQLPGIYGALAMPLNYPNAWDRRQHRQGYGIWMHGSDRLGAPFTPHDTRGCVLMRNEDLVSLARLVTPQVTPVLIAETVDYRPAAAWQRAVQALIAPARLTHVLAVVTTPEYTVVMHQEHDTVVRDFVPAGSAWAVAASERAPIVPGDAWRQKLGAILPATAATLLDVHILDATASPSVVIDTSAPAQVREVHPDGDDRLYLDLLGVRTAPVPFRLSGTGTHVKEVRVAPVGLDPPITRLVVDLRQPMRDQIAAKGNQIVVSLEAR